MDKQSNQKNIKWLGLSITLILLDISVKRWITTHLLLGETLYILPGVNYYYTCNTGLAFGLFSNIALYSHWIFVCLIIFVIIMLIIMLYKLTEYSRYYSIAYSMIIGGAVGNLIDRVLYGAVIDFIDIHIKDWHWPIFNVADIVICIGIIVLLITYCNDNE